MTPGVMESLDRLFAERACERPIIDFVRRLDLGEPGSVSDLLTPTASGSGRPASAA